MNFPTEQDLLQSAITRDQDSLAIIYDLYSPGLYRYAFRLSGDDCLAEDCVSETFSRFLRALQCGGGPRDHLKAYLYRIAHNWITDGYSRLPQMIELGDSITGDETLLPEKQAEKRFTLQRVRLALRSLTPDQRQVILLRYIEGWENDEVAVALEKPVGAVKALQHRALASLRRFLGHDEGRRDERFAEQL